MAGKYAAQTTVSVTSSKQEIESILQRYGADQFIQGWDASHATIGFRIEGRMIRIDLPLPSRSDPSILRTEADKIRTRAQATAAYEQACRQSWRALALVIKAKLEAITAGISSVEHEFLADVVLPDGQTFGKWAQPQLEAAYTTCRMPALLPGADDNGI